jgi:hypothetical protein
MAERQWLSRRKPSVTRHEPWFCVSSYYALEPARFGRPIHVGVRRALKIGRIIDKSVDVMRG